MIVETRNPKCHVRIVSLEYGEILAEMVRPSIRSVSIHRRLGEAAGSFQFVLLPRPLTPFQLPGVPSSWRDVLGVHDFVEISIEVPPRPRTIVMRGFIDTVTEQFSIQGGKPQRTVHVNGRDYGKLLLNTKLYYLDEETQQTFILNKWRQGFDNLFAWKSGEPPNPEHTPLARNAATDAPQFAPRDLLQNIVESFYKPQEELVLRQLPTAPTLTFFPVTNALLDTNERELATIAPTALALNFPPFSDIWTLLRIYQHHPWRELYVSDEAEGPVLIYRPSAWMDFNGRFVFPGMETGHMGTMLTHQIYESDIAQLSFSHSGEQMHNFFFTYPDEFGALAQMVKTIGPLEGLMERPFVGNPYLVGYQVSDRSGVKRSDFNIMGFHLSETRTPYLDFDHQTSEGQIEKRLLDVRKQGLAENLKLVKAFDHTSVLEFGAMQLKGNENIRIGHYLQYNEGPYLKMGHGARYYVEGVSHVFQQGSEAGDGLFLTNVEVSRGRGHMIRKGLVIQ